jgi:DNA (cytosine-5)-methyltransferase 1
MTKAKKKKLRAIDLYSGIGGWSLGLKMAGIDVVASYEWWNKASLTNHRNNGHLAVPGDIRDLNLDDLPGDIDVVVGSPPCTQFSFANRGGNGDIEDGLKDIAKFLEIVDHLKPSFWAMENVPRVAGILEERLAENGSLAEYRHLKPSISIVDMAEWGIPQKRKRCIIGNFDHDLLRHYRNHLKPKTLGDVVERLSADRVRDPIYGFRVAHSRLTDHVVEDFLSPEEERINRENKTYHPIYNNMEFPDLLGRPARTITATCTRVTRESVVIEALDNPGGPGSEPDAR